MHEEPSARAAGYARVSTLKQAEEGFSLGEQEQRLRTAIAERGWSYAGVFVDEGRSGRSVAKRPALLRMLEAAEAGEFSTLLIPSLDRLGRSTRDLYELLQRLELAGVTVLSLRGDVDTSSATGRLLTGVMAVVAQFESDLIGERVRSGRAGAARAGRPSGGPRRFGFERQQGKRGELIPRAQEVVVAERIVREVGDGRSQAEVARGLNADGLRTAQGRPWNQSQISQLVRDPVWVGKLRSREGLADGQHGELVALELWERAQAGLPAAGERRGRPSERFLLSGGLLKCGRCGSSMRARRERKSYGFWEAYLCSGRTSGASDCDQPAAAREPIDSAVIRFFEAVALDVEGTIAQLAEARELRLADVRGRLANARRNAAQAERQLERLDALLRDGEVSTEEWRRLAEPPSRELESARLAEGDLLAEETSVSEEASASTLDARLETISAIASLRAAVAGEITSSDGIRAAQAALRRSFDGFVLAQGAEGSKALLLPLLRDGAFAFRDPEPAGKDEPAVPAPGSPLAAALRAAGLAESTPIHFASEPPAVELSRIPLQIDRGRSKASER
jgi:site-specific DNA recombinase